MTRKAILMMAYGSPNNPEDIEPYLQNVRGGQPSPPELIDVCKKRYAAIGGRSPLLEITRRQATALQTRLNRFSTNDSYEVFVGMRHWFPYIQEGVEHILRAGYESIIGLCMTPYYSNISTRMYFQQLDEAIENQKPDLYSSTLRIKHIESFHDHPLFLQSLQNKLEQAIEKTPEVLSEQGKILFTAHSLPVSVIQEDPYEQQITETCRAIADRCKLSPQQWKICYQSAGARKTQWLGPSLESVIDRLADESVKNILVSPLGFVSDHIEILFDIDIAARQQASRAGIHLERCESLNSDPVFIEALTQIIIQNREENGTRTVNL